jgi:hypothetical protein
MRRRCRICLAAACRQGCTSRKAASYNQFPYNTGPQGMMTAVWISQVFAKQKPEAKK